MSHGGRDGKGEARVGRERGGGIVVLAAGDLGIEVAGLDVGEVPRRAIDREGLRRPSSRTADRAGGASSPARDRIRSGWS